MRRKKYLETPFTGFVIAHMFTTVLNEAVIISTSVTSLYFLYTPFPPYRVLVIIECYDYKKMIG